MPISVVSFRVVKSVLVVRVKDCDSDSFGGTVVLLHKSHDVLRHAFTWHTHECTTLYLAMLRSFVLTHTCTCNIHDYAQKFSDHGLAKRIPLMPILEA